MLRGFYLNFLSLSNILLGFIFILLIGDKIGVGVDSDIYFSSLVFIAYINILVQAFWEAVRPYYSEVKYNYGTRRLRGLYITLTVLIVFFSGLIITFFLIFVNFFQSEDYVDSINLLKIMIFIVPLQNLLMFNKLILNLEEKYVSYYSVDIFIYASNIMALLLMEHPTIYTIAIISIVASIMSLFYQLLIVKRVLGIGKIEYDFNIIRDVVRNSSKLKLGALFYSSKDPLIAMTLTSVGDGIFTLYSYANKFASAVYQVVNAPAVNVYVTDINRLLYKSDSKSKIKNLVVNLLKKTISLYIVAAVVVYLLIPVLLGQLSNEWNDQGVIDNLLFIYLILVGYYLVMVIESPFSKMVAANKWFYFSMFVNFVFSFVFFLGYLFVNNYTNSYYYLLVFMILAQSVNLSMFYFKSKSIWK